ncbi:hypothetical protein FSP39_007101 [Pinctada imbricata]|uniref:Uncharacterized protein n=1 Tax=Pinctada imbricata TaxID=66713 RepID=A0AA88YHN9_PINIB|nr:hypothetical protein FSP39_007101 [Pinctada imbricata]
MVIMLGLSIVLQLGVGVILILLGFAEGDIQKDEQSKKMNNVTVGLILAVLVLNVFIGAFGIELT